MRTVLRLADWTEGLSLLQCGGRLSGSIEARDSDPALVQALDTQLSTGSLNQGLGPQGPEPR